MCPGEVLEAAALSTQQPGLSDVGVLSNCPGPSRKLSGL